MNRREAMKTAIGGALCAPLALMRGETKQHEYAPFIVGRERVDSTTLNGPKWFCDTETRVVRELHGGHWVDVNRSFLKLVRANA